MPPRRKGKKVVNKRTVEEAKNDDDKSEKGGFRREEKKENFVDEEVERQIAAIKAIRDVETEQMLTSLRLLRSNYTEDKLQMPVLEFFKENLPGLTISKNENEEIELKLNNDNKNNSLLTGNDLNCSILNQLAMDLPDNVKASLLGTDNTHLDNLVFPGAFESQMLTSYDALHTPGQSVSNDQRMSFGMTPKTRRQPKPGEMMLSVHGSPLGVYREDDNNNMGAINEENS